jgi:hypothetical protein
LTCECEFSIVATGIPPAIKENIMQELLRPIRTESSKDEFITRFEELILSGIFPGGQKLPSERELALQPGGSRPEF